MHHDRRRRGLRAALRHFDAAATEHEGSEPQRPLEMMPRQWDKVLAELQRRPPGTKVRRACKAMPRPEDEGAQPAVGLPAGQVRDWRFPPNLDCSGLHVHEMDGGWEAHLDRVHPSCSPIEHARVDAPPLFIGGGVLLGALAGGLAGWKGAAFGAVAGGVLGAVLLTVPKFNWEKSHGR